MSLRDTWEELGRDAKGCRGCIPVQLHAPVHSSLLGTVHSPKAERPGSVTMETLFQRQAGLWLRISGAQSYEGCSGI